MDRVQDYTSLITVLRIIDVTSLITVLINAISSSRWPIWSGEPGGRSGWGGRFQGGPQRIQRWGQEKISSIEKKCYFQLRKKFQWQFFQLRKGSKDEIGRKGSNEVGPPWKGLCTGQLLTAEVTKIICIQQYCLNWYQILLSDQISNIVIRSDIKYCRQIKYQILLSDQISNIVIRLVTSCQLSSARPHSSCRKTQPNR